jgi:hypothetical protein
MAEKLVLVPEAILSQQHQQQLSSSSENPSQATRLRHHMRPIEKNLSDLDSDIERVLQRDLPDDEKVKRYFVILDRYLEYHKQRTQTRSIPATIKRSTADPSSTPASTAVEPNAEAGQETMLRDDVIATLPKGSRDKADRLLRHMQHSGRFHWDSDGHVYINGQYIRGSNITDLLYEAVHHHPTASSQSVPTTGSVDFYRALDSINVPKTLLNKSARDQLIKSQEQLGADRKSTVEPSTDLEERPSPTQSPKSRSSRRRTALATSSSAGRRQRKSLRLEEYTH